MDPVTLEELEFMQKHLLLLRFIFGITYDDLAKYIGLTKRTIKRIESGKSRMTKPYYYAISECFRNKLYSSEFSTRKGHWYYYIYQLFTNPKHPWSKDVSEDDWIKRQNDICNAICNIISVYEKKWYDPVVLRDKIYDDLRKCGFKSPMYFKAKK